MAPPRPSPVLYLAIPAHNEVATIGVLLWRLRTVLAEFPREYEVVVYDDASTDETADVAEQYMHAMPVTVLRGTGPIGYAGAVNALVRHIAAHTRYPRRDAMLLLQGDFTDPPGIVPEFARRFEGGADVVVGERTAVVDAPRPVRRLFAIAGWALKPFVRVEGVKDLTGSMRLIRISALRDLLRVVGDDAVCEGDSWTANADLLLKLVPHARRVETVPVEPTYGVRTRETRRVTVRDALAALRWAWRARGRRAVPTSAPEGAPDMGARNTRQAPAARRRDEPEVTADKLRERSRERDRLRGEGEPKPSRRDERPARSGNGARPVHPEEQKAQRRQELRDDPRAAKRVDPPEAPAAAAEAPSRQPRPPRTPRPERQPRSERSPRGARKAQSDTDAALVLDDPFAGAPRSGTVSPAPDAAISTDARIALTADARVAPHKERIDTPIRATAANADQESDSAPDTDAHNDADVDEDSDSGSDGAEDGTDVEATSSVDGPERKRRRNRRSRRRTSRTRGEARDEIGDTKQAASDNASHQTSAGPASPYADEHESDRADQESNDAADDASSGESEASDDGSAARAKRRGRRGRRGGSRRSRGRGRDGATDGATDAGADNAPPPPSAGDAE